MTDTKPNITAENHHFSSDDKIKWWGYGEWVEEPEEVLFNYLGVECKVLRSAAKEPYTEELHIFGGHLCGYVAIPSDHPYLHRVYEDMAITCHYGLTFGEVSDAHWIGFDCAHSGDLIPSMEHLKKINPVLSSLDRAFPIPEGMEDSPLFNPTYKNINYCIQECMDIVEQLVKIAEAHKP